MTALPFDLRVPVCAAPMFLVSSPQLVIEACKAGIMGAFPTPNVRSLEELDGWMAQIVGALEKMRPEANGTIGPWAVNLVTHSTNSRLPGDLELVARYKPPVVITALGSPKPAIEVVHGYGGIVIADVINATLARKAVQAGADGVACICAGAGGHTGFLSPFAFVSAVRSFFDGLVIVGGGIADGWGIAGAIAAGADIAYIGTRFIASQESAAASRHKELVLQAGISDLIVSASISGTPASWLRQSIVDARLDPDNLAPPEKRSYDSNAAPKKRWSEIFAAGQGVGSISALEPVADIVASLERDYLRAKHRLISG
jgi:nitronate monooxygenase